MSLGSAADSSVPAKRRLLAGLSLLALGHVDDAAGTLWIFQTQQPR